VDLKTRNKIGIRK